MSPIEKRLLDALIRHVPAGTTLFDFTQLSNCRWDGEQVTSLEGDGDQDEYGSGDDLVFLYRDVVVGSYRADFVFNGNGSARLAVECDGHDWHDRTKQQAAYDRARDRELFLLGFTTIRFTGSEIHHSADRCAAEIYAIFKRVVELEDAPIETWHSGYAIGYRNGLSEAVTSECAPEEHW